MLDEELITKRIGWKYLLPDEKIALSLKFGFDKSIWQVGMVIQKPHYKSFEVINRSLRYLDLYTEFFSEFDDILSPNTAITNKDFITYIRCILVSRKTLNETYDIINNPNYLLSSNKVKMVSSQMELLKASKNAHDKHLHDFIIEFDRWNNFRILPIHLQEPSAFKRRDKRRLMKLLNTFLTIEPGVIDIIKKKFAINPNRSTGEISYLILFDKRETINYHIIPVDISSNEYSYLSERGFIIYKKRPDAEKCARLVSEYYLDDAQKTSSEGIIFWNNFRNLLSLSLNYITISKINPMRNYFTKTFTFDVKSYNNGEPLRAKTSGDIFWKF